MKIGQLINLLYEYSIGDEDEIKILADVNGDELALTIDGVQSIDDDPVFYIKASED